MGLHKVIHSIPEDLLYELNTSIERRRRSQFITEAIRNALKLEKEKLAQAYKDAAIDEDRNREIEEWSITETEGWEL